MEQDYQTVFQRLQYRIYIQSHTRNPVNQDKLQTKIQRTLHTEFKCGAEKRDKIEMFGILCC